jgi:methylated-DNA-protein-cysteine methyltransferase related protein
LKLDIGRIKNFYQQVYDLVAQIPRGRVMTYGQIAVILGKPTAARAVGYGLHQSPPGVHLPWQRVINAQGKISPRGAGDKLHEPSLQRILLEEEGVSFDAQGRIDLRHYLWEHEDPRSFDDISFF